MGGLNLERLIGRMSPSRLEAAQQCLARVYFQYVDEPPPRAMGVDASFGNAFDELGNDVYAEKIRTGETPKANDVADRFAGIWEWHADYTEAWGDDTPGELLDRGTEAAKLWRSRIAAHVFPHATQERLQRTVTDPITGERFDLYGYVDLRAQVLDHETVVDLKAPRRRIPAARVLREFQAPVYSILTERPWFEYHVVTRNKNPQTQILRTHISDSHRRATLVRAGMLRRQIRVAWQTGDWLPNRTGNLCSRRWCDHWQRCERKYGGRVPD